MSDDQHSGKSEPATPQQMPYGGAQAYAPPWQKLGHQLTMGLRGRAEANWLPFDDLFGNAGLRAHQLALKASLSQSHHKDIFNAAPLGQTRPNSSGEDWNEAAGEEVYDMVRAHLDQYHDQYHDRHHAPFPPRDAALHPLDAAARLIPEDLLLLAPQPDIDGDPDRDDEAQKWHLVTGALAFPAHWVLAQKMGKPLAAIHEPVPHYAERLETAMDRFFNKMQIGPISSRMNWSMQAGEDYYAPHRAARNALELGEVESRLFLRVENQTLRKLPKSGQILFTIRTHMVPIAAWRDQPDAIAGLVKMMADMSPLTAHYKGIHLYRDALTAWLAEITR